jgi:hypothetical protein
MKTLRIQIFRSARSPRSISHPGLFRSLPQAKASFSSCPKLSRTVSGYRVIEDNPNDTMVTKAEKKKAQRFELKTPKGTKDCMNKVNFC